jgi:hypothetical protein
MMSRADFRSAASDWAVVGWVVGLDIKNSQGFERELSERTYVSFGEAFDQLK